MRKLIIALIVVLIIVHQDFWFWNTADPMVFGFIPIGLAYQAGISIAAAILWAMAVCYCWPEDADVLDEEAAPDAGGFDE